MTKSTGKASASSKANAGRSGHSATQSKPTGQFATVGFGASGLVPRSGFLAKTRLKKSGGSLVMTVPAPARNLLHLTEGQEMVVSVDGTKIVVEPIPLGKPMQSRRPKYTLDELVVGMNPELPLTDEERAWMDEPAAGREIW